jgi:hypothetical protein
MGGEEVTTYIITNFLSVLTSEYVWKPLDESRRFTLLLCNSVARSAVFFFVFFQDSVLFIRIGRRKVSDFLLLATNFPFLYFTRHFLYSEYPLGSG